MATYFTIFVFTSFVVSSFGLPHPRTLSKDNVYDFPFVSRDEWLARPPKQTSRLITPAAYVIIHHSYQPGACYNFTQCSQAMRSMQDFHQISNGWGDIGYNFAVGSDGATYEGRGWNKVGAHAYGYNTVSIGIVLIGDWISSVPPPQQLQTTKDLIAAGVKLGYIRPNYYLVGHRQTRPTECPGDALFQEITTWDNFTPDIDA